MAVDGSTPTAAETEVLDAQLDHSIDNLFRIITEDGPPSHQLRDEIIRAGDVQPRGMT